MMSAKTSKEEQENKNNLASFLPSNLLSELDESINSTSKNTHKESNVSNFINNL